MKEENKYTRLLCANQIKSLYHDIGVAYRTEIDIINSGYDKASLENTLALLIDIGFIILRDGCYEKLNNSDEKNFESALIDAIENKLTIAIEDMFSSDKHFDTEKNRYFIYRNEVKTRYLGLLMICGDLGEVDIQGNRVFFKTNSTLSTKVLQRKITKEQLDKILEHEEELGEEAERVVMEYETNKLLSNGIELLPIQVSQIDVAAGFDILSYFPDNCNNKYIEVKSCDNSMTFYMSDNEVKTAQLRGNSYFLYLYNRVKKSIEEFQNPYACIFVENDNAWQVVPSSYKIQRSKNI